MYKRYKAPDGQPLYSLSVSVVQAGVICTSFLLTKQLEIGDWKTNHDRMS